MHKAPPSHPQPTSSSALTGTSNSIKESEELDCCSGVNSQPTVFPHLAESNSSDHYRGGVVIDFQSHWSKTVEIVDLEIKRYLDRLTERAPDRLRDAIAYSLLAPGKRLRPVLALWGAEAICGSYQPGLPAAVAVEMIHCYSLIHDDLPAMDDDDLRRGRPTCHIQFDEATAILAGDALQPMAFEVLATGYESPHTIARACRFLAEAAGPTALVGGQSDDLRAEKEGGDARLLELIHARKTGAMIRVSVALGAMAAGATSTQLEYIMEYGAAIGQVFQIVDDLLDVHSTAESMGKRTGKDEARGKLTYPSVYGIQESQKAAFELTQKAIRTMESFGQRGKPLVQLARYILERSH